MPDGPDAEFGLLGPERLLDVRELRVDSPEFLGLATDQVRPEEIAPLAQGGPVRPVLDARPDEPETRRASRVFDRLDLECPGGAPADVVGGSAA